LRIRQPADEAIFISLNTNRLLRHKKHSLPAACLPAKAGQRQGKGRAKAGQRQGKGRAKAGQRQARNDVFLYFNFRYVSGQSYIEIFQSVLWGFFTRSKKPQSNADYILSGYLLLSAITLLFAYLELWSCTNYYPSPCFQIFLHRLLPPGVYCSRQVFLNPNLSLAILF